MSRRQTPAPAVVQGAPLVRFEPRNEAQKRARRASHDADILFLVGPAGTGKTACAVGLALEHVVPRGERVAICRPAVEASRTMGYAKGTVAEKYANWTAPVVEAARKFVFCQGGADKFLDMRPMEYLRGATFESAAVLDEAQNCSVRELLLFLTRLGAGAKLFVCGDPYQSDVDDSGLLPWIAALKGCKRIACVAFPEDQNLRHPLVAEVFRRRPR